jgi:hypothetical protein
MPMRAIVLPQPEPGHAILRISDLDAPAEGLALSLQRQQGPDSHLADDGWRRTEAWLVPAVVERVKGALEFHLGPEICDRLAGTSTVRLRVKEPDIGVVGTTVVAWPQMLTSGAVDPSARGTDDLVRLRRAAPVLRAEPRIEPTVEPELPPPLVMAAPELPPRLPPEPEALPPPRSNAGTWLVTMIVLVILIAGGVYAYLFHREQLQSLIAGAPPAPAAPAPTETAAATPAPAPAPEPTPAPPPAKPVVEPPKKSARMAVEEYLATKPAPDALMARARQYAEGKDLPEAFLIWRAAAEAGHPPAELEVASFYDPLLPPKAGFTPDGARAADWYERAALAGNVEAQRRYGLLLAKGGAGLAPDPAKARTWLQQAADQKDVEAKKALDALPK